MDAYGNKKGIRIFLVNLHESFFFFFFFFFLTNTILLLFKYNLYDKPLDLKKSLEIFYQWSKLQDDVV